MKQKKITTTPKAQISVNFSVAFKCKVYLFI